MANSIAKTPPKLYCEYERNNLGQSEILDFFQILVKTETFHLFEHLMAEHIKRTKKHLKDYLRFNSKVNGDLREATEVTLELV